MTTAREQHFLVALDRLTADGVPPSCDELAKALGVVSKSNIYRMARSLRRQGLVTYEPRKSRSLRAIETHWYSRPSLEDLTSDQLGALRDNALAILAQRKGGAA